MLRIFIFLLIVLLSHDGFARLQANVRTQDELAKLPMYQRLLEGDDAQRAEELEEKYDEALEAEDWTEAKRCAQVLLQLRIAKQGTDHYEVIGTRQMLERVEIQSGLTPDERGQLAEALQQNEQLIQLYHQGQYRQALQLAEAILATREKILGENHPDYITSLGNLANLLANTGDYKRAQTLFEQACELRKKSLGENHPDYALCLNNFAALYYRLGAYEPAKTLYLQARSLYEHLLGENSLEYIATINNLAMLYQKTADYAKAEPLFLRAGQLTKILLGEDHPNHATNLSNLATLYRSIGEYAKAEPLLVQAMELRRRLFGENHPDYASSLNNLAALYERMGEYGKAEPLFLQALNLRKNLLGENHPYYAQSLNNLAYLYDQMREYEKAESLYLQACELREKLLGVNHPDYALSINGLAALYKDMREYSKSETLMLQGLELRERLLGKNHPHYVQSLHNLAILYNAMKEYEKAELLRLQANEIYKNVVGENHPHYVNSLISHAALYQSMDELSKAQTVLMECCRSFEMSRIARATGFQRAISGANTSPYLPLAVVSAQLNNPRQAYQAMEQNLSRAFLDVQAERREQALTADQQARTSRILSGLSPIENRIAELVIRANLTDAETTELADAIEARSRLNVELAELAAEMSVQEVSDLGAIQGVIPAGHALLAWVDISTSDGDLQDHWVCLLTSNGNPIWSRLIGSGENGDWRNEDGQLPFRLREALAQPVPPSNLPELIEQLRRQRIEPVLPQLMEHGITQLYVVGVEQMAGLPVEVIAPEFTISYIPSGTFLARLPGKPNFAYSLLAVGDPIYELDRSRQTATAEQTDGQVASREGSWVDLPGTRFEVVRIAQLFESPVVLLDSHANEAAIDAFRRAGDLDQFRYLHFATHGKGNHVTAFESKLILSQDHPHGQFEPGEPWYNNEISAREVLDFWELNADLVTLSACQTGLGRQGGGEGLLGFAQAFLLSGARSVCLSLWEVDDIATALLMQRFYQNLLGQRDGLTAPMPKAKALEEAKHWLRNLSASEATALTAQLTGGIARGTRSEKTFKLPEPATPVDIAAGDNYKPYSRPHFWSAFILIGDPD